MAGTKRFQKGRVFGGTLPWQSFRTLGLATLAALIPASANAGTPDAINQCREAETDAARIACLEAALKEVTGSKPETEISTPGAQTAADTANSGASPDAETQPSPEPTAMVRPAIPQREEPTGLGAEQVISREVAQGERKEKERRSINAEIVAIDYTATGRPIFRLDNGQVWRGKEPDPIYKRFTIKRHKRVKIQEALISGYQLTVDNVARLVPVERIK